jgi:predicted transcriptional regulator
MSISETIKQAVRESGWTNNALANHIGVPGSTLHRFMVGDTSPFALADKLADILGLEIVEEIKWPEYVEQYWPEYVEEAWVEYEKDAWAKAEADGWKKFDYSEWYEQVYAGWHDRERAEWEQAERKRLEPLPWVRLIEDE